MKLSLSRLDLAKACPGSVRLYSTMANQPANDAMKRGTALHYAWQLMLSSGNPELSAESLKKVTDIFPVTSDDIEDAMWAYWEVVQRKPKFTVAGGPDQFKLLIEHTLKADLLGLETEVRADGSISNRLDVAWLQPGMFATIFEGKFGVSEVTHPKRNFQVISQAVLLAEEFQLDTVGIFLLQPQAWHGEPVRPHVLDSEALEFWKAEITRRINRTKLPDAPLQQGNHCRFCPAKNICPARSAKPMIPEPSVMSLKDYFASLNAEGRRKIYEGMQSYRDWSEDALKSIEALAAEHPIEGYGQVPGEPGKRKWSDEMKALKALKKAAKVAGIKPEMLMGPASITAVEKVLKGKPDALALLTDLVIRPDGKPKFGKVDE